MTARTAEPTDPGPLAGLESAAAYVPCTLLESMARDPGRSSPWYERIEGTLLMGDVSGFTAMSELLAKAGKEGAEWLTDIINSFFGSMLGIAREYGGDTITFGGDAVLLLFRGDAHARRACAAALAMLDATAKLPAYKVSTHRVHLGMSMGAHSGEFFLGSAGVADSRLQCLLFGPGAARTCQTEAAASSGELFVTAGTVEALADAGTVEECGGFYRVLDVQPIADRGPAPDCDLADMASRLPPYLPPAVAASLAPGAPPHEAESDHRKVCVVFINIMGVDELLASDGPDAVLRDLQSHVSAVVRLADRYGGYLVSNDVYTQGLKLIVAFGAPVAHEHDSTNAARMVSALRCEVDESGLRLAHRTGVNAGFVFAGDVGPSYRRQYTVMGDAVNLAARLMSAASAGETYVSAATLAEAGPGFAAEELEPITVKGKKAPVAVCALIGECEQDDPAAGSDALVGRDEELRSLEQAAEQTAGTGRGGVAVIRGEPGIGKSRLLQALRDTLDAGSWDVLAGGCQPHTSGQPFAPWTAPLLQLMGSGPGDSAKVRAARIRDTVRELRPESMLWIQLFAPLLGADLHDSDAVRTLKESDRRERLFALVADLLRARAARSPVALIMEDLHWSDSSTLALLGHVVAGTTDTALLVVVTSRLEPPIPLDLPADALRIDLAELPASTAVRIVSDVLGRDDLPDEMARILLHKTRGNPLFLQEVARSLAASGKLDGLLSASGSELAERMAALEIPDRVQGLVMARIDALPERTRDVLRTAAVIGTTFERSTLSGALGGSPDGRLDDEIAVLTGQEFADPDLSAIEPTFHFHHALIQEVAYDSLKFSKRRDLHRRIGEYLEQTRADDLEPFYESLVRHFSAARHDEKTRLFAVKAAGKARRLFAHDEAVAYYRRAMATVRARSADAARLRSLLGEQAGDSFEVAGRPSEAAAAYKDALHRWDRGGRGKRDTGSADRVAERLGITPDAPPVAREAALCRKIGFAYGRTYSDYDLSLRWLGRAISVLPPGQPALRARISLATSHSLYRKGEFETSMTWARRGLELATRCGDVASRAYAMSLLANDCFETGRLKQAIRYDAASLPLYIELDDLSGQALAYHNLGTGYAMLSLLDKALEHFRLALDIMTRVGNIKETAPAHVNIAETLVVLGDYDPAIDHLLEALEACRRTGTVLWLEGFARLNLARAYQGKGLLSEALAEAERSVALMEKAQTPSEFAEALLQRAELELEMGGPEKASRTCESALEKVRSAGIRRLESRGLRLRGRIQAALGDGPAGEASIRASIDLAKRADEPLEKGLGLLALAMLHAASDRTDVKGAQIRRLLRDAAATLTGVGARAWAARANELAAGIS